ncbi:MAG TPA: sulfotransferase [Acidimicrobiales bacterium]|nr:sulfotransferase [Acidimicrobiales bacterium]
MAGSARFGSGYEEPLQVLARALSTEAHLTTTGRYFARDTLVGLLERRVEIEAALAERPAILEEPVEAPVVIVGLPRSGTTLLQGLLAADDANRSLRYFEATRPCPPPEEATYLADPRIARCSKAFRVFDYLAPQAKVIHPLGPTLPTECVSLLNHSFASLEFAATYRVPSYVAWYLGADLSPHYRYYLRQLQLLQSRWRRERWVLKSPTHLFALPALTEVFPSARIVQLHRDPLDAVASFASMVAILRGVTSDHVDLAEVGREWSALWLEGLRRFSAARPAATSGGAQVLDVDYRTLVADPVATVLSIYERFGLEPAPGFVDGMRAHLAASPQHLHGVHRYSLEQFSLRRDELAEQFAPYLTEASERLGVALEEVAR